MKPILIFVFFSFSFLAEFVGERIGRAAGDEERLGAGRDGRSHDQSGVLGHSVLEGHAEEAQEVVEAEAGEDGVLARAVQSDHVQLDGGAFQGLGTRRPMSLQWDHWGRLDPFFFFKLKN